MKALSDLEYNKIADECDFLDKMSIKCFTEPRRLWMQKHTKFRMSCHHKVHNLGTWKVNWDKIQK